MKYTDILPTYFQGFRYNLTTGLMNGAPKHDGWWGRIPVAGGYMTEVSIGAPINGAETEMPLITPNTKFKDLKRIARVAEGAPVLPDLKQQAIEWAKSRISSGKSPFYNGDSADDKHRITPYK